MDSNFSRSYTPSFTSYDGSLDWRPTDIYQHIIFPKTDRIRLKTVIYRRKTKKNRQQVTVLLMRKVLFEFLINDIFKLQF